MAATLFLCPKCRKETALTD
jgi:hypothetical protein